MRQLALILLAAVLVGCQHTHAIVRTEDAPLYSDEQRTMILTHLDRLAEVRVRGRIDDRDPLPVEHQRMQGYANRADLRPFTYRNERERVFLRQYHRREVLLEDKDWPPEVLAAIRQNRLLPGMTGAMVELAWGPPTSVRSLDNGEEWRYERTVWETYEVWGTSPAFYYDMWYGFGPRYGPGFGRRRTFHGPAFGFGYRAPLYHYPTRYRGQVARTEHRVVTFDAEGRVIGWT